MSNLLQFSISEILSLLEKKEFSTKELVETYINAIEKTKDLNMYLTTCFDQALEQAKVSDQNYLNGNQRFLEGIPLGVKDMFCTKGIETTASSKILKKIYLEKISLLQETSQLFISNSTCTTRSNPERSET